LIAVFIDFLCSSRTSPGEYLKWATANFSLPALFVEILDHTQHYRFIRRYRAVSFG